MKYEGSQSAHVTGIKICKVIRNTIYGMQFTLYNRALNTVSTKSFGQVDESQAECKSFQLGNDDCIRLFNVHFDSNNYGLKVSAISNKGKEHSIGFADGSHDYSIDFGP